MSSTPSAIPKSVQNSSFLDLLKPRYHEAVFRLRNTIVALVILVTLTHLLPLPTPYASLWKFYRDSFQSSWEKGLAIAENYFSSAPSSLISSKRPSPSAPLQHLIRLSPRPPNPKYTRPQPPSQRDAERRRRRRRHHQPGVAARPAPAHFLLRALPSANSPFPPLLPPAQALAAVALVPAQQQQQTMARRPLTRAASRSPTCSRSTRPPRPTFHSPRPRARSRLPRLPPNHWQLRPRSRPSRLTAVGGRLPDVRPSLFVLSPY
ncbi:hypothetical protein BJV74DRAFT_837655, partial [Russula compacta]